MDNRSNSQTPTADESIAALRELLSVWSSGEGPVDVRVMDNSILRGLSIRVQVEHAIALTHSVMLLVKNAMYMQSIPLVRMTMECAVTAAWMAVTPYSAFAAAHDGATKRQRLLAALADIAGEVDADTDMEFEAAEFAAHASGEAAIFEQRCLSLAGGEWIYGYYRLLSEASHSGTALLDFYMDETEDGGLAFADLSKFRYTDVALGLQVVMLHIALISWDEVSEGHPNAQRLTEIASHLGINSILGRRKPVVSRRVRGCRNGVAR
jgi:hypothetical protein